MPILKEAGIPVITVGVRTDSLTDRKIKTGWPVFRLAPRADARGRRRRLDPDRAVARRSCSPSSTTAPSTAASSPRRSARNPGRPALKPVFVDTFRPQLDNQIGLVGRLRKAGATHVFVGGDRDDIAILGRDAAGVGYDLTIAAGETLRAAPARRRSRPGTLMIGLPEWAEIAARQRCSAKAQ